MFAYCGITMVLIKKISLKPFKVKGFRLLILVRMKGLEPPRLSALDPKSSASANSATPAISTMRMSDTGLEPVTL